MSFRYVYEGSTGGYPLYEYEPEEEPIRCELCEGIATDKVDLDPLNPSRYVADLCKGCADFERARINREIKNEKLFKLKHA
jgi:hypothetical protein